MAISQDSKILHSDLNSIYTKVNSVISNYGGNISTLSVPTTNTLIDDTHINQLNDKFDEMKKDTYLKLAATWTTSYSDVTAGTLITPATVSTINTIASNLVSQVSCRYDNYYSNGSNGNSTNNNGNNSNGKNSNSSNPNSVNSNNKKFNSTCFWGHCGSNGACTSNGTCASNGDCTAHGSCGSNKCAVAAITK